MEIKLFLTELQLFKLVIWAAFYLIGYGVCEIKSSHTFKWILFRTLYTFCCCCCCCIVVLRPR